MKILIMRPEQPHETREVSFGCSPDYHTLDTLLRPILDGADLEHVTVLADTSFAGGGPLVRADMFVDEMSAVKPLPRNEAATLIYRRASMMGKTGQRPPRDPEHLPAIYGTAVLFSEIVWR